MKVLTRQEEQILLAVYHLKNSAYLIPIREQIKRYTGKYLSVGTIYAPLNRLCRNGFLESYLGEPSNTRGGKAIKYYRLTEMGFQALAEVKKIQDEMWEGFRFPAVKKET
jgi:DNA-binding PadR family transcriptional regulator